MRKIEIDEYKKIAYQLLVVFSRVCEEYDLKYVLDCGTLLGAVRHQGYIPWDDDIDVTMPREDYNKLIKLNKENRNLFGEDARLAVPWEKGNVGKVYLNLVNPRTITISPDRDEKYFYPIWLDIFPMDKACATEEEIISRRERCQKAIDRAMSVVSKQREKISWTNKLKLLIKRCFHRRLLRLPDLIAQQGGVSEDRLIGNLTYDVRDWANISYYTDYIYAKFEEGEFRIPREYDKRLTALFEDYMTLPPEEERCLHSLAAYWID